MYVQHASRLNSRSRASCNLQMALPDQLYKPISKLMYTNHCTLIAAFLWFASVDLAVASLDNYLHTLTLLCAHLLSVMS